MLPEFNAGELMFLAAVALIVVGPKDLPILLRKLGKAVSKMRALAADFRSSFDEMARQSELDDLRKEVEALRNSKLEPLKSDLEGHLNDLQHSLNSDGTTAAAPDPAPADDYQPPWMPEPIPEPIPQPIDEPAPEIAADPPPAAAADAELAAEASPKPARKPRAPRKPKPKPEANA